MQIEKSSDGVGGGWKLRGVKLVVNGRTLYRRDGIERWLEDNRRTWRAPDFRRTVPTGAALPITLDLWDEDSFVYGANDHGDIEPFDRRKRLALAYPRTGRAHDARDRRQPSRRSYRRRRLRLGDVHDRDAHAHGRPAPSAAGGAVLPPVVVEPPPPPPPVQKPDLVISDMGYSDADKYYFTVKNQGNAAPAPFSVSVTNAGTFSIPDSRPAHPPRAPSARTVKSSRTSRPRTCSARSTSTTRRTTHAASP